MKKIFSFAVALAGLFLAASCQQESLQPEQMGETVTFTVNAPAKIQTKAIADGLNVNELVYEVWLTDEYGVLTSNAQKLYQATAPMAVAEDGKNKAKITLDLVRDQKFTILFWAQVEGTNFYDTDELTAVTYKNPSLLETYNANDESLAAFYGMAYVHDCVPVDANGLRTNGQVTLRRPFAQVNLGTLNTSTAYTVVMEESNMIMDQVPTVFNVATKEVSEPKTLTFKMNAVPADPSTIEVKDVTYQYAGMNYVFAGDNITLTYNILTRLNGGMTATINNTIDSVPVEENRRTNIIGNLLTSKTDYVIVVDAAFVEPDLPEEDFDQLNLAAQVGGEVTLSADLDLVEPLVVKEGVNLTLDLNGYSINGDVAKSVGHVITNNGTLTIKGGVINSLAENGGSAICNNGTIVLDETQINGAPQAGSGWPSYAFNNYGDATLKNVTIESNHGAVAANAAGTTTLENVTVNMNGFGGSSHVFYIANADATVVVNGGTYNHNGNVDGSLAYTAAGTIVVNDGTFSASNGGYGMAASSGAKIIVNGGTFNNAFQAWGGTFAVKGGTFKQNPKNYVAEGYVVKTNANGTFTVLPNVEGVDQMVLHEESGLFYNGNNALSKGVYYITSASDLKKAAAYFYNQTHTNEANKVTIELMSDVDLAGTAWEPWSVMWMTFNGNNHTISNVTVSEAWRSGFFGYLAASTINDLTLKNVNVAGAQAGVLAGGVEGVTTNNLKIAGNNSVTYMPYSSASYTETWGGIGALTGVLVGSTINAEIVAGATVTPNFNGIETEATFISYLTGYIQANSGAVTVNGTLAIGTVAYKHEQAADGTVAVTVSASSDEAKTARSIVEGNTTITSAVVKEGVEVIGNRTFRKCSALETISLPSTLTEIEQGAFQSCSNLNTCVIPASVQVIGQGAFAECKSLTEIVIPDGVTRIEKDTFRATGVEEMVIPASVTYIGDYAFRDCYQMKKLYIMADNLDYISSNALLWAANPDKTARLTVYVKNETVRQQVEAVFGSNKPLFTAEIM